MGRWKQPSTCGGALILELLPNFLGLEEGSMGQDTVRCAVIRKVADGHLGAAVHYLQPASLAPFSLKTVWDFLDILLVLSG
jgi:hypothetical protein